MSYLSRGRTAPSRGHDGDASTAKKGSRGRSWLKRLNARGDSGTALPLAEALANPHPLRVLSSPFPMTLFHNLKSAASDSTMASPSSPPTRPLECALRTAIH